MFVSRYVSEAMNGAGGLLRRVLLREVDAEEEERVVFLIKSNASI